MPIYDKFSKYYDLMYSHYEYEAECDYLEELFNNYAPTMPKSILDIGCGTGTHAYHLAGRRYQVFGFDMSETQIQIAKEKVGELGPKNLEFQVADMRDFTLDRKFDIAISMFGSVGYLTTDEDIHNAFQRINEHLDSAGLFVFEFWNLRGVIPGNTSWLRAEDEKYKVIRLSSSEFNPKECTLTLVFETYVLEGNKVEDEFTETHLMRVYSPNEMKMLLKQNGFALLDIVDYRSFDPPKENSFRLMAIAQKL
ncbi:MAG: class I SAM-dependent DNA methyltransferase [Candidatus Thorarchaeota archaeon]|jgi:SAM-dependent methyltransferase